MERSRKLTLTNWTKANDALQRYFDGNKSKLAEDRKVSRTTLTAFFKCEPVREAEFRKIAFALYLDEKDWQVFSEPAIASNEEDWIEEVRSRCCEKILYQHGTIQLLNQTEIEVDQLYVDVWLLNRSPRTFHVSGSTLLKSFDLRNDRLGLGDRIKCNEGMKVANDNARLLIQGKPGAGKTTFLQHLAVDCSNGKFQPDLIPVLIEFAAIQSKKWNLLEAISEELSLENQQTQTLLEQGKLLILMDGLDEVPLSGFRRNVQEQLRSLAQEPKHSGNRFILTCRTQIIEVIPQGFTSVEVADFNTKQVKKFVENWFRASGRTEADITQQWLAFSDAMEKNSALKELTATPVLLSLMCLVLQDERDLPAQTASLYRKGIRLLLEKWNDRKEIPVWEVGKEVYRKLTLDQKEALLIEIAARKFENSDNFVLFEQTDLARQIANFLNLANAREGEAVLKAIEAQHGLLVERADELWSFSHLTFQEYFTAQWLTQPQQDSGWAEKMADERWKSVVKLAIKSQQPADRLFQSIKQAIDCSVSGDAKLQGFLAWVQAKAEFVNAPYKPSAIRSFYVDLALYRDFVPDLSLVCDLACDFAFTLALHRSLDRDQNLVALARNLALAFALALNLNYTPILANKLQRLTEHLPEDFSVQDQENVQYLWRTNGQVWPEKLRQVMIEHRNIGHDWQFNESQEQALQSYHDANKFLVELLKEPGAVSDMVRQEIEDNLLLPIATLRQRQPEIYEKSIESA
ncbi:MAG: NACHT domain-containing protein [Myxacorys chilensis ATA2-1-KO14]|jgi:predicted NACHT family NTPase|nr:NACHT domain-containing protein [Myxacorys chilensis ATA2-1-KO14]